MLFAAKVVPIGTGQYGPFENGKTIPYLTFMNEDGDGDPMRATAAEGVDLGQLTLFSPEVIVFDLGNRDGKLKLRTHGLQKAA